MKKEKIFDGIEMVLEIASEINKQSFAYYGPKGSKLGKFQKSGNHTTVLYAPTAVSTAQRIGGTDFEFLGYFRVKGGASITKKELVPIENPSLGFEVGILVTRIVRTILFSSEKENQKKIGEYCSRGFMTTEICSSDSKILLGYSEVEKLDIREDINLCSSQTLNVIKDVA